MRRKREIPHSAWDVYEALCAWADSETGVVEGRYIWNQRLVEWTGLKLGTVKNALTELRRRSWIIERGERTFLLVGTFLEKSRELKKGAGRSSSVSDGRPLGNDGASPHSDAPSPVNDSRNNRTRARSDQPLPAQDQTTHTSPARAPEHAASDASAGGGVGVSEFSEEERAEYAESNCDRDGRVLGEGWVRVSADGNSDGAIRRWKARGSPRDPRLPPQAHPPADALPPPAGAGLSLDEAREAVTNMRELGRDVRDVIADMPLVDEGDREGLLAEFCLMPLAAGGGGLTEIADGNRV
ncbi:MAG TPA: hypothetical protein VGP08_02385 [Pyrinomonadaceae bacterium]|nr:hypothetical protein [Pyrinomonadaceae bacterium]